MAYFMEKIEIYNIDFNLKLINLMICLIEIKY